MKVLITGASRGIGLELTRVALSKGHQCFAVIRQLGRSSELEKLKQQYSSDLQILEGDVRDEGLPAALYKTLKDLQSLDLLINNAGVYLEDKTPKDFLESYTINAIAPYFITQAMLPLLKNAKGAKVVQITSKMGSIADNGSGSYYSYRSSKAALNMISKSLAKDHPWLSVLLMHPGWVKTDMGGEQAPVLPKDSAEGIWRVIERMDSEMSGTFVDYQGQSIPW